MTEARMSKQFREQQARGTQRRQRRPTVRVVRVQRAVGAWELGADDWDCEKNTRARVKDGRALYESVWTNGNRAYRPVRLARLEMVTHNGHPQVKQVEQWVDADTVLEVVEVEEVT